MSKKIHLLTSEEKSRPERDAAFSRTVADIHRQKPIDTLFLDCPGKYSLLETYCQSNKTQLIDIESIQDSASINALIQIANYSQQNPNKTHFAYVSEQSNLEKLTEQLSNSGFEVDSREV